MKKEKGGITGVSKRFNKSTYYIILQVTSIKKVKAAISSANTEATKTTSIVSIVDFVMISFKKNSNSTH